jgi:hypothetical protein
LRTWGEGGGRCFIIPDPTLMLPLQQQQKASDLKLFHTLPTARIWCCLTLFRAFKTHPKVNHFTHDAEVPRCFGKMVSKTAWKYYTDRLEKLV